MIVLTEYALVGALRNIGFREIEAKIYAELLRQSHVSGYAISLKMGIAKAQIYTALEEMTEKGYVSVASQSPQTYAPVPMETIVRVQKTMENDTIEKIRREMAGIAVQHTGLDVLHQIDDYTVMLKTVIGHIENAKHTISLQLHQGLYHALQPCLQTAVARSVKLNLIISVEKKDRITCDFASELYLYDEEHSKQLQQGIHWLWMIIDQETGVFGNTESNDATHVVVTKNVPFSQIISEYIASFFTYRDFVEHYNGADYLAVGSPARFHLEAELERCAFP